MITLSHNQVVRGNGLSEYTNRIVVYTARGCAVKWHENPEVSHKRELDRGYDTAFTIQDCTIICAGYAGKEEAHAAKLKEIAEAVELTEDQIVMIEGDQFKVKIIGHQYSSPIKFIRLK